MSYVCTLQDDIGHVARSLVAWISRGAGAILLPPHLWWKWWPYYALLNYKKFDRQAWIITIYFRPFFWCIQALPGHSFASTPTTWQRQRFWTTHSSGDCAFWRFETWPKYPGNWTWPMPTKTILWRSFFCDIWSVCRNPCEACSSEGVSIAMSHPFTKSRYDRVLVCGTKKDKIMYSK